MQKKKYLAYGANTNLDNMSFRCPDAVKIGTAVIKDYELMFRGHIKNAYATIEPCKGSTVQAVLWEINEKDELSLDRFEGYPRFYIKEEIGAEIDGNVEKFMAYIMNDGFEIGMPSGSYFSMLEQGYKENGLDSSVLYDALSNMSKEVTIRAMSEGSGVQMDQGM